MIRISNSSLINGLREIGSSLITRIKQSSSVLAHIGSVSNTGANYYQIPKSFYKQDLSKPQARDISQQTSQTEHSPTVSCLINIAKMLGEMRKDDPQLRMTILPSKIVNETSLVEKRGELTLPDTIIQLAQTIEKDNKQSTDWFARHKKPVVPLKPTRQAPLPPLSKPMIEKPVHMIESDKQSANSTRIADSKLAIKDTQFDIQMHLRK